MPISHGTRVNLMHMHSAGVNIVSSPRHQPIHQQPQMSSLPLTMPQCRATAGQRSALHPTFGSMDFPRANSNEVSFGTTNVHTYDTILTYADGVIRIQLVRGRVIVAMVRRITIIVLVFFVVVIRSGGAVI